MENISHKLEKYRTKLINATEEDKIEMYNLKMQQYLILQKQMIKTGGSTKEIFAVTDTNVKKITEETSKKIKSHEDVYTAASVKELLANITNQVKEHSEDYNDLQKENSEITAQLIKLHRDAADIAKASNVTDSPLVKNIEEVMALFRPIQNVLVEYYVKELKGLAGTEPDEHKLKIISEELKLFDRESTIKQLAEKLVEERDQLPTPIRYILYESNDAPREVVEEVATQQKEDDGTEQNESVLAGGRRYIYKKY
jgi:hypothetical protein